MNEEYAAVMFEVMVSSGIDRQPMSANADKHQRVGERRHSPMSSNAYNVSGRG